MKRAIIALVVVMLGIFVFTKPILAKDEFVAGENIRLQEGETVEGDYFAAGNQVEIYGNVTGDVYVAGGVVIVDGNVGGDVLVAGGAVAIGGNVAQNVRVVGGQVNIRAQVGKNVSGAASSVDISSSADIQGNLAIASGDLNIDAPIGGNIQAGVGSLVLSNIVGGDVTAGVGMLSVTSSANIGGDLTYYSENKASISDSASISGSVIKKDPSKVPGAHSVQQDVGRLIAGFARGVKMVSILTTLILGVLLVYIYPQFMERTSSVIKSKALKSSLVGLAFIFLGPLALALVALTIVGIPLVFIFAAFWVIIIYLSRIFIMYWVGRLVATKFGVKNVYLALLVGAILYYALGYLGDLGSLVAFAVTILGTGAYLISGRAVYLEARKAKIV